MNIGIGKRNLVVSLEKVQKTERDDLAALIGATDREVEQFVRKSHANREPRWDITALMIGHGR